MALLHGPLGKRARLEGLDVLGALPVEADFGERRQAGAQALLRQDGHPPFDHAGIDQPLHPAQAGGRRGVHDAREVVVRKRRITLKLIQDAQVGRVKRD